MVEGKILLQLQRARDEVRASEERYRALLEQSPDPIFILDARTFVFTYANPMAEAYLGYQKGDLPGIPMARLHPADYHFPDPGLSLTQGQVHAFQDVPFLRRDGAVLYADINTVMVNLDGRPQFLGFLRDVTARKSAEKEVRRLKQAVEQSPTTVMIMDTEGRIEYVNSTFRARTGYSAEEVLGQSPAFLRSGMHAPEFFQAMWEVLKKGEVWRGEIHNRKRNGEYIWENATISPVLDGDGKITGYLAVKEDITERKVIEEALRVAKTAADAANEAKSAFLANMSHEIRTPLNAVLGFMHLLGDTPLTAQQQDFLDKANLSARDLLGLINDILDFSKIEAQRVSVERIPFALGETLDHLAASLSGKASEKGLKLVFDLEPGLPPALVGDPLRLGQILRNLGSNAVKFTVKGEVKLSVRSLPATQGMVRLCFRMADTGIGMSRTELGRLFQPFTQADDSTTRRFGGTGLGLAISRRLAELMGGSLEVESQPGQGSVFTLTLAFQVPEHFSESRPDPGSALQGQKVLEGAAVLLVEDNPLNRQLATLILQKAGAQVTVAMDGVQAVEGVRGAVFDVVLMDLQMPVMGGYEATREIRKHNPQGPPVIIALTADAVADVRDKVLAAGMDDCLTKPIDAQLLVRTVASHFKPKRKLLGEGEAEKVETPPWQLDRAGILQVLEALRRNLEADEAQARQNAQGLERLVRGSALEGPLAPLKRMIESYEFPRALPLLEAFRATVESYFKPS